MLKIRLTRTGRKNHATFRISVTEARTKRDTKSIELVGHYLPHEKKVEVNAERINHWLSVGAQPSPTVKRLLVKAGVLKAEKSEVKFNRKPGKKATERTARKAEKVESAKQAAEEAKKAAEAPVEVAAPAEEAPAAEETEAQTEETAVESTETTAAETPAEEPAAETTEASE